jgi:hypothetical protein
MMGWLKGTLLKLEGGTPKFRPPLDKSGIEDWLESEDEEMGIPRPHEGEEVVLGPGQVGGMKRSSSMTDGQSEALRASSEDAERIREALNLAVAKAAGLEAVVLYGGNVLITPREWDEIRGIEHTTCEGDVACIPFRPSTDLNAAFEAAEVVGLFDCESGALTKGLMGDGWFVRHRAVPYGRFPTPALAICTAILKLREKPKGGDA